VTVYYRGNPSRTNNLNELFAGTNYNIGLNDLKESVRFTVCGLDYYTP